MTDVWDIVHVERAALIGDLEGLSEEEWRRPSLCPGWSVHDVAAHLVDNALATPLGLIWAMTRARFDFDRQNQRGVQRQRGATPAVTLDRLRAVADRRTGPPVDLRSRLAEEVLHGEDIRRPLGIAHAYSAAAIEGALRYQVRTSTAMGGSRQLVKGLSLRATDLELRLGAGPEVSGSGLALLMALSGRSIALDDLTGAGVDQLRRAATAA